MARATKTTSTRAKTTRARTTDKAKSNGCTLTIKPKVLTENLNLLNAAVSSNKQGLDRLKIEVGDGQSVFSIGGDIGVEIRHKANKTFSSPPVQVSCRQLKNLASNLDGSNQKLALSEGQVTISNQKGTYQHSLVTYKDVIPQDNSQYNQVAKVKAVEFKQALDKVVPFLNNDSKEITSGVCLQIKSIDPNDTGKNLALNINRVLDVVIPAANKLGTSSNAIISCRLALYEAATVWQPLDQDNSTQPQVQVDYQSGGVPSNNYQYVTPPTTNYGQVNQQVTDWHKAQNSVQQSEVQSAQYAVSPGNIPVEPNSPTMQPQSIKPVYKVPMNHQPYSGCVPQHNQN